MVEEGKDKTPTTDPKDKDKDQTITIRHEIVKSKEEPKKEPATPAVTPAVKGGEDFAKKMKELEDEKNTKITELETQITDLTTKVDAGKGVQEELDTAKGKLLALANAEFEKQKALLVDTVKEKLGEEKSTEIAEKITSVEELEGAKVWINYLNEAIKIGAGGEGKGGEEGGEGAGGEGGEGTGEGKGTPKKPPAGVATREPAKTGKEYATPFHLIDEVTNTINSRTATKEDKKEAYRKLDALLQSMVTGYKKRSRDQLSMPVNTSIGRCRVCNKEVFINAGGKCPLCNAEVKPMTTLIPNREILEQR